MAVAATIGNFLLNPDMYHLLRCASIAGPAPHCHFSQKYGYGGP
jgi:hypothetical protein